VRDFERCRGDWGVPFTARVGITCAVRGVAVSSDKTEAGGDGVGVV
jgi:hypothetical protein